MRSLPWSSQVLHEMFLKKNILAAALMLYDDDMLHVEELVMYFAEVTRKNPQFPYWEYDRVEHQIQDMSEAQFKYEFRFSSSELSMLADALKIPDSFTCVNGTVASGVTGHFVYQNHFVPNLESFRSKPRATSYQIEIHFLSQSYHTVRF